MALFEVFIPARDPGLPNVTLKIEGRNWIEALKSGLKSIGEGQESIANVMCDIKEDNSIHVTDVATGRVFRLREMRDPAPEPAPPPQAAPPPTESDFSTSPKTLIQFPVSQLGLPQPAPAPAPAAAPAPISMPNVAAPAPVPVPMPPPAAAAPTGGAPTPAKATSISQQVVEPTVHDTLKIDARELRAAQETERISRAAVATPRQVSPPTPRGVPAPAPKRPSGQFQSAPAPQSREETKPQPTDPKIGRAETHKAIDVQDAIAAVFDATQDLYMEQRLTPEAVAERLLDIALSHIPADAGTFYLADVNAHELTFAAVRGPKADALKRSGMTVKLGQGIIGFCAQEGVCLSVSDIQKDPRWLSSIAQAIDYKPKDTLCASAEKDGRLFGAVQLINSKGGFDASHMEVLRFIGLTAAALLERAAD